MPVQPTDRDRLAPYLGDILTAATEQGFDPFRVAGLVMRESGATWAPGYAPQGDLNGVGDHGHGHGLCQIDDRFHADFLKTPEARTAIGQLRFACHLLHENRRWLGSVCSKLAQDPPLLERAAFAAFNAGEGAVHHSVVQGRDPDSITTGGDYSANVFARAEHLRSAFPLLFAPPPNQHQPA